MSDMIDRQAAIELVDRKIGRMFPALVDEIRHGFAALDTPAPAMGELVEAAKVAIDVMGRVDGANDCSRGINALEAALAKLDAKP